MHPSLEVKQINKNPEKKTFVYCLNTFDWVLIPVYQYKRIWPKQSPLKEVAAISDSHTMKEEGSAMGQNRSTDKVELVPGTHIHLIRTTATHSPWGTQHTQADPGKG